MQRNFKNSFFDALLIIFSVLFALLVTSSYDYYQTDQKKKIALKSIEKECVANQQIIKGWQKDHTEIRDLISSIAYGQNDSLKTALQKFDFLNFGILTGNKPLVSSFLSSTAWETSKVTGLIGEFDFKTAQILTQAYDMQNMIGNVTLKNILNYFYSSEAHEIENITNVMMQFSLRMYELTSQEETVIILYEKAIEHLQESKL